MAFFNRIYIQKEKCPHCSKTIYFDLGTGLPSKKETIVGTPFAYCKNCFGEYIVPYKKEWITMSVEERKHFNRLRIWQIFTAFITTAFSITFFLSGINEKILPLIVIGIGIFFISGLFTFVIPIFKKKYDIKKSIQRTKKDLYLLMLFDSDYEFYHDDCFNSFFKIFPKGKGTLAKEIINNCMHNKENKELLLLSMQKIDNLNTKFFNASNIMAITSNKLKNDKDFIIKAIKFDTISISQIGKDLKQDIEFMNEVKKIKKVK